MKSRNRRRDFLKWSAASLAAAGGLGMPAFLRRLSAAPSLNGKKVLCIFCRGGMDGVQAVIPYGDQGIPGAALTYEEARPDLRPDRTATHDLNGFCSLFPTMQGPGAADPKLADIFRGTFDERGPQLAVLHRIGYEDQNRSHFSSQQFYENASPGNLQLEEGFFNRYLTRYPDADAPIQAATLNTSQMVLLKGQTLVPVLRSIDDFALPGNVGLGTAPTPEDPLGVGLKGAYGQAGFDPAISYESLTYSTGSTLLENLQFFEENVRQAPYEPEPGAQELYDSIADRNFRSFIRDCAQLLKQVDGVRVVGCNQNGYDTHGNENVAFPALVGDLAKALTALYIDLKPIWEDILVMTLTEFGRTSLQNANRGTDHAEACCSFAMGGGVVGNVYNCDSSTWANGDLFSTSNGRYVAHRTDFRAIYHEVLTRHLSDPDGAIDEIIPGYSGLVSADTSGYFTPLNFLSNSAPPPVDRPIEGELRPRQL